MTDFIIPQEASAFHMKDKVNNLKVMSLKEQRVVSSHI